MFWEGITTKEKLPKVASAVGKLENHFSHRRIVIAIGMWSSVLIPYVKNTIEQKLRLKNAIDHIKKKEKLKKKKKKKKRKMMKLSSKQREKLKHDGEIE